MKKFMALMLALVMVLSLAACGTKSNDATKEPTKNESAPTESVIDKENDSKEDPTESSSEVVVQNERIGYYVLTEASDAEGSTNSEDVDLLKLMEAFGLKAFIVMEKDGKGFMHLFGEEREITWTDDEIAFAEYVDEDGNKAEASTSKYVFDNKTIIFEQDGSKMVFTKSDETAPKRGEIKPVEIDFTDDFNDNSAKIRELLTNPDDINVTDLVLVDNDEVAITVKSIELDDYYEYDLKVMLENKTDKALKFDVESCKVNGLMVDAFLYEDVAAGKKANADLYLEISDLLSAGLGDPSKIELNITASDSKDWSADPILDEIYTVYPLGEDKATQYVREAQPSDKVLVDNDDVKVTIVSCGTDEYYYTVRMYLENKTDKPLSFDMRDASVNEFMMDPYFSATVLGNSAYYSDAHWDLDDLKSNGIENVTAIEFALRVCDAEDWSAADLLNEVYTVNP